MKKVFKFLNPGRLIDGDLELVLVARRPADPELGHVPWYQFDMRKKSNSCRIGTINLRIGTARQLRCSAHIGYKVNNRYRGYRYAARSCRLLFGLAMAHGLKAVWMTCEPRNKASARTLELAGGQYIETIRVPRDHEMYAKGSRYLRRYRADLRKELLPH